MYLHSNLQRFYSTLSYFQSFLILRILSSIILWGKFPSFRWKGQKIYCSLKVMVLFRLYLRAYVIFIFGFSIFTQHIFINCTVQFQGLSTSTFGFLPKDESSIQYFIRNYLKSQKLESMQLVLFISQLLWPGI